MSGGREMDQPQRLGDSEFAQINPITERIIGCAIEVHRALGPGLYESIYRSALSIEFELAGLKYIREAKAPAVYKERVVGMFRLDFLVEDIVVVEVKSVERMDPVFDAQLLTYMRLTKKRVGLLINFNSRLVKDGIARKII
jgi:GxxExxY protein